MNEGVKSKMYDIIVIGAGSGGLNIAGFMNTAGFKVLLIDKSDSNIGGDCLNFGCVPSKALIHISKLVNDSKISQKFGSGSITVEMKKVKKYILDKQNFIRKHENANYFRKKGMDVEFGKASFVNKNKVRIGNKFFSAKKIVIATGSRPNIPKIKGLEKVNYLTNENIFSLEKLPEHLLVIGGGPIGMELGQAFKRLGSEVTIVQRGPQFLPKEEKEVSEILLNQLKKEKINFLFNTTPKEFIDKKTLLAENKNGKKYKIKFDAVLISAGRKLNVENLDLEKAGIEVKNGKLVINEYLQTTNKNVFAVGDVVGSYQFTHAAELHAGVVLSNFFSPFKKKLNNDHLSWVTFTSPEIATFGLNETELIKKKLNYEVLKMDFKDSDRHIVEETNEGLVKLYVHKDKILGGTMVGENAGELFQELVLANSAGIPMKKIFEKIYAYPTASRINKAVISQHYKNKLTPFVKKILKWLY